MTTPLAHDSIEAAVAGYYSRALAVHGPTHRGVDWSSRDSQELRFATLLDGVDWCGAPRLLDFGCGCGALAAYLDGLGVSCDYTGYDVAPEMVRSARRVVGERADRRFTSDPTTLDATDHVLASGIFNVKLDVPANDWQRYVEETIAALGALSRRRLAFNMLPPASSPQLERADLHYADRDAVVELCVATLGADDVAVREHYGLWEFTVVANWNAGP
jgi:SAM-dependent methyltransferase